MVQNGSPTTKVDLKQLAVKYINHKIILSKMLNYRRNQQYQLHIQRLKYLLKWLKAEGKYLSEQRVFVVMKMYKPDFYGALPFAENKSYESCVETLKEIFE